MSISIEEVYIAALRKQMKKWKKPITEKGRSTVVIEDKETPEHVMRTIKTFMFSEKLCAEITKVALIMCENPTSRNLEGTIQDLIAKVHFLIISRTCI